MTEVLESFYKGIPDFDPADRLWKGNIKARTRMIYLYYYANNQRTASFAEARISRRR